MQSTKKFPVGINPRTRKPSQRAFLVPASPDGQSPSFLCIETGKPVSDGMIAYVGIAVSSEEILEEATRLPAMLRAHLSVQLLDDYLLQIHDFKIGDVVCVKLGEDGKCRLERSPLKVSFGRKPNLP
jgi:hypothetical protein